MKLAINGGKPVLTRPLSTVYNIGAEEVREVVSLLRKGPLSNFVGVAGDRFLGGKNVKRLEAAFCKKFGVSHAVSFNSASTALSAAVSALSIGPGDEVIVPPFTMSASVMCVIANGAVPVFADIDGKNFCIDPKDVISKITKRTKAIMVVNLFGGPANFTDLLEITKKFHLKIIEDNAQSPGAKYGGKFAGTIGDVGIFSFNVHKVMQSGEGGVLITNNNDLAFRAQLVRNHGEIIADSLEDYSLGPIFGSNLRMTELEAVIAYHQLAKLDYLNSKRIKLADYLTDQLSKIDGLTPPYVDKKHGDKHVYYLLPIKVDAKKLGISRDMFADAMTAEGFPMSKGYVKPIYLLKLFAEKKAFNNTNFPFDYYDGRPDYSKGLCPVCERLWKSELTYTDICQYPRTKSHIDKFLAAVEKVINNGQELLK